ncbi:MAG: serine protease AprX, partial [Thermoleophilaceae bacterium]|nr:serine protease AprX [Thermoleophilaceae bacterium]
MLNRSGLFMIGYGQGRWTAAAVLASVILGIVATRPAYPAALKSPIAYRRLPAEPRTLYGLGGGMQPRARRVEVTLLLRVRGSLARVAAAHREGLAAAPGPRERRALRHASARYVASFARSQSRRRRVALESVSSASRDLAANYLPAYRALAAAGGRVLAVSTTGRTVTAQVPRARLRWLERRPDVEAIVPTTHSVPLNIGQESLSVGAPVWWTAGYSGGRGTADIPANFAVDQDPVQRSHPAFSGITFVTPPGAPQQANPSTTRHGTALLSIAAAQGPTGCSICQPADADERGVAPGVGKVLDPSGAGAETDWAAGVPYYWYDNSSSIWKLQPGAPDPAQVINFSRGNDASYDDSIGAQEWDATVDSYGITATVAAGNNGPAPRTVNDPALAYNVIGVGAFSGGGTTDPSDDSVFAWSSRGPTVGGRKKPDLVAVGDGGLAYSYYESTGKLWKYDSGTSYAAPQVGGGAILLAGAGIRDPKVVKAILINSARSGRATPAAAMGTQVGWLPDWGWG